MITEIRLKNFKIFKEETIFPTNRLTLLTGVNGAGKSSMLQPLLLMRQSIEHDERTTQIIFNGSCVELGSFMDVKNSDTPREEPIVFGFEVKKGDWEKGIEYILREGSIDGDIGMIEDIKTSEERITRSKKAINYFNYQENKEVFIFLHNLVPIDDFLHHYGTPYEFPYNFFATETRYYGDAKNALGVTTLHYIAADRIGPKPYYEKITLGKFPNVGAKGEQTANVLYRKEEHSVNEKLYLGEDAQTLIQQTEEWLSAILGGAKVELKGKEREHAVLSLLLNTDSSSNRYRPSNVGFGYTYILPIIVSGLIAKEGEILIVENPEAHLHPKAQSKLTQFLAKVASCGVQVFIETHSEHILNGLRLSIVKEDIEVQHSDITVLYFQDNENERFVEIPIRADGGIDKWPDGFFDQTDKDLERILGI